MKVQCLLFLPEQEEEPNTQTRLPSQSPKPSRFSTQQPRSTIKYEEYVELASRRHVMFNVNTLLAQYNSVGTLLNSDWLLHIHFVGQRGSPVTAVRSLFLKILTTLVTLSVVYVLCQCISVNCFTTPLTALIKSANANQGL